jgi:hypothetical protein
MPKVWLRRIKAGNTRHQAGKAVAICERLAAAFRWAGLIPAAVHKAVAQTDQD